MNFFKRTFAAVALLITATLPSAASTFSNTEIATLQAVMQSHIDHMLVDGGLLQLNTDDASVRSLYPAKAHPKIMTDGKFIVMCADFRDNQGKDVMVNFYLAKRAGNYVVFATTFGMDGFLAKKMKSGELVAAN